MTKRTRALISVRGQWRGDVLCLMGSPAVVMPNAGLEVQTDGVFYRSAFR
jgi:hypothetical protein